MATLMKQCMETFFQGNVSTMRPEWARLTPQDKADLTAWFEAEGIKIDTPTAP